MQVKRALTVLSFGEVLDVLRYRLDDERPGKLGVNSMINTENLSLSSVLNWAFPCPTIKFVFKDINGLDGVKFSRKATTIGFRSFG